MGRGRVATIYTLRYIIMIYGRYVQTLARGRRWRGGRNGRLVFRAASSSAGAVRALVEVDLVRQRQVAPAARDAGQLEVDGRPLVVERGRLEYDGARAHYAGQREHPQEEPVKHHRHVLPVFDHLWGTRTRSEVKNALT